MFCVLSEIDNLGIGIFALVIHKCRCRITDTGFTVPTFIDTCAPLSSVNAMSTGMWVEALNVIVAFRICAPGC